MTSHGLHGVMVHATGGSYVPDILYSPVSVERRLLMLNAAEEALEPTVSTRSKPGGVLSGGSMVKGGRRPSSACGRRVKGFRIGILGGVLGLQREPG